MSRHLVIRILLAAALAAIPALACGQDATVTYDVADTGDITITSEIVVREGGSRSYRRALAGGSRAAHVRAYEKASREPLRHRVDGTHVVIEWTDPLAGKAERRILIEEQVDRSSYVSRRSDGGIQLRHAVPPGRIIVLLPPGYNVEESSVPVQITTEAGRSRFGFVNTGDGEVTLRAAARRTAGSSGSARIGRTFRAEDERSIVYWLEDPATQQVRLALELFVTHRGQAHVYSVLRDDDNITNPMTLDVDRGRELPTRRITGREANRIGDSPVRFPDDASVLVADLGYAIPEGGSARVRMYQTATDVKGYRLLPDGELQWDRFLARLRTRAVLPAGWVLTSLDQPAVVDRDEQGRVTLDFLQTGGDSPPLRLTARRAAAGESR